MKRGPELARSLDVALGDRIEGRFEGCLGPAPLFPLELLNTVARLIELCAETQYRLTQLTHLAGAGARLPQLLFEPFDLRIERERDAALIRYLPLRVPELALAVEQCVVEPVVEEGALCCRSSRRTAWAASASFALGTRSRRSPAAAVG